MKKDNVTICPKCGTIMERFKTTNGSYYKCKVCNKITTLS